MERAEMIDPKNARLKILAFQLVWLFLARCIYLKRDRGSSQPSYTPAAVAALGSTEQDGTC